MLVIKRLGHAYVIHFGFSPSWPKMDGRSYLIPSVHLRYNIVGAVFHKSLHVLVSNKSLVMSVTGSKCYFRESQDYAQGIKKCKVITLIEKVLGRRKYDKV